MKANDHRGSRIAHWKTVVVTAVLAVVPLLTTATPAPAAPAPNTPRNYGINVDLIGGFFEAGTTDLGIDCDDCTKEIALPFAVNVYGNNYTSVVVSSNGNVQFTTNNNAYSNGCLPNASMGVMVAPYWDDLTTAAVPEHGVFGATKGASPDRVFVIEWRARLVGTTTSANFSLAFHESPTHDFFDPDMEFGYGFVMPNASGATIGLQRPDRSLRREYSCNSSQSLERQSLQVILASPMADFEGNGSTDVGVFRPSTGTWFLRNGQTAQFGTNGDKPVPFDYDDDGDSDIAVFRPSTGTWFLRNGQTAQLGTNGDIPVPGRYGSGETLANKVAVFRPSTGTWFCCNGHARQFGTSGDIPVPADYDGDGYTDFAVFRPSNGYWYVDNGTVAQFGTNGDIPVPGDYTGDGVADMAVFRPSNGYWFVRNGPTVQFGTNGDIPVPGHYNGDPFTVAVFRPSNGYWFVQGSPLVQFGTNGDIPLPRPIGSS